MPEPELQGLKILIVAEHASAKFGGEAALPLHYFRQLRRKQVETWMVVHSRTQAELRALLPGEVDRLFFVRDTWLHVFLDRCARYVPGRLAAFLLGFPLQLLTQLQARPIIKKLVREKGVNVIHQPIPVSPKMPSAMFGFGVPVVIGPMNGGMSYPGRSGELRISRAFANLLNQVIPGKIRASALLVANRRTREALPWGVRGAVTELVENGVDLSVWGTPTRRANSKGPFQLVFVGRLVDWKCVDLLLEALKPVTLRCPVRLSIVGEGPERARLEGMVHQLDVGESVSFTGWLSQQECAQRLQAADALVLPSMLECGGAAVLEAMATGLPVIATNWGGPADYLDSTSGILVDPLPREAFISGLTAAMLQLAESEPARRRMGESARKRAVEKFDWEKKVDSIIEIYRETIRRSNSRNENICRKV